MATAELMPDNLVDDHNIRQQALQSRVLLLAPTLGYFRGMYQLPRKKTKVEADGKEANKADITVPRVILITDKYPKDANGKPWKKRFQQIQGRLEAIKDEFSVKFRINGVRIVPKSQGAVLMDKLYGLTVGKLKRQIAEFEEQGLLNQARKRQEMLDETIKQVGRVHLTDQTPVYDPEKADPKNPANLSGQSIAYQLRSAAEEFCAQWPDIREQLARDNSMFHLIEHKVPKETADLRGKFYLDIVPIELAGTIDSNELTTEDLREHNTIVRDACHRRVEEAISEMIEGPRQQLADALAALGELINRDGAVKSNSFNQVRKAIAKIRMFDCVADKQLLETISNLEKKLDTTVASTLNSRTAAENGFSDALNSFMDDVQNEVQIAEDLKRFGRTEYRSIDLD